MHPQFITPEKRIKENVNLRNPTCFKRKVEAEELPEKLE